MNNLKYMTNTVSMVQKLIPSSGSKNTKQLLDPLTTLAKIALLKFKPENTRLHIKDHKISFQDVTSWTDWTWRQYLGDMRFDLHNLSEPLLLVYNWYSSNDERIVFLSKLALDGLVRLEKTYIIKYGSDVIIDSLDKYKNTLRCIIDGSNIDQKYEEDKNISDKFQKVWIDQEINVLYEMFKLLQIKDDETSELTNDVLTVETFLDNKDIAVSTLIKSMSISFTKISPS
jgi:hypothetical protein